MWVTKGNPLISEKKYLAEKAELKARAQMAKDKDEHCRYARLMGMIYGLDIAFEVDNEEIAATRIHISLSEVLG